MKHILHILWMSLIDTVAIALLVSAVVVLVLVIMELAENYAYIIVLFVIFLAVLIFNFQS